MASVAVVNHYLYAHAMETSNIYSCRTFIFRFNFTLNIMAIINCLFNTGIYWISTVLIVLKLLWQVSMSYLPPLLLPPSLPSSPLPSSPIPPSPPSLLPPRSRHDWLSKQQHVEQRLCQSTPSNLACHYAVSE